MIKVKVFEALYQSDTESDAITLSIHRTKEGAERAIAIHKAFKEKECAERRKDWSYDLLKIAGDWDRYKWWGINETELKD